MILCPLTRWAISFYTPILLQSLLILIRIHISTTPVKLRTETTVHTFRYAFRFKHRVHFLQIGHDRFPCLTGFLGRATETPSFSGNVYECLGIASHVHIIEQSLRKRISIKPLQLLVDVGALCMYKFFTSFMMTDDVGCYPLSNVFPSEIVFQKSYRAMFCQQYLLLKLITRLFCHRLLSPSPSSRIDHSNPIWSYTFKPGYFCFFTHIFI